VLIAPGVSFNVPYRTHFRVTNLPDSAILRDVFTRMEDLLSSYATAPAEQGKTNIVEAVSRFK
jgi:alanine-synthesizing transaminase